MAAYQRDARAVVDQVVALDTISLAKVQTIPFRRPCVSVAVSDDGAWLYAVDMENATLFVFDTATGQETRAIVLPGSHPVYVVEAP